MYRTISFDFNDNKKSQEVQLNVSNLPEEDLKAYKKGFNFQLPKFRLKKKDDKEIDIKKNVKITEHLLSLNEISSKLQTNIETGLSEAEAASRLARDGPNAFTPPAGTPIWKMMIEHYFGGFAVLLWIAAVGSLITFFVEFGQMDVSINYLLLTIIMNYY